MTPWLDDGDVALYHGDALTVLAGLDAGCVQTCVTSPPYWGLRDYGIQPSMWGGNADCSHEWVSESKQGGSVYERGDKRRWQHQHNGRGERQPWIAPKGHPEVFAGDSCSRCGMWCGELGLEATPELYAEHMVILFRAVARVLADDGTLWLNLGDCFNAYNGNAGPSSALSKRQSSERPALPSGHGLRARGLKPKDLVGIPWRIAFALQADGWYLRSDIIWSKPNPMPESVTDRPTKAHEYLFLLSKSERYFYDADAIRETAIPGSRSGNKERLVATAGRSVWEIPTRPTPEAHFATFPEALVAPCILAGSPGGGLVLDPFMGSGTTALVARKHGRRAIGVELNEEYLEIASRRLGQQSLLSPTLAPVGGVQ